MHSLLAQSEQRWSLLIRDDASQDETRHIIDGWQSRLESRIDVLSDSGQTNLGVAGNFSRLLQTSRAPYLMFANPDDVWMPDKIEQTLHAMTTAEKRWGRAMPCLVHTDLQIVDGTLQPVADSLWRYQGLVPHRGHSFSRMCVENTVWGCTAMLNRALVDLGGDVPPESHHEDWWMALVAASFGKIVSLPLVSIKWRRHGHNDSQISSLEGALRDALASPLRMRGRLRDLMARARPRVRVLLARYRDRMSASQIAAAEAFLNLDLQDPVRKRLALMRHRLLFTSWRRNLGLLIFI